MKMNKTLFAYRRILLCCTLLAVLMWMASCKPSTDKAATPAAVDETAALPPATTYLYDICTDSLEVAHYVIRSGDNLSLLLAGLNISPPMIDSIAQTTKLLLDPKKLRVGLPYSVLTAPDSATTVRYLVFATSLTDHVIIDLSGSSVQARLYRKEVLQRQKHIAGAVNTSLWKEIKKQGVDPLLAIQIADIFAWQIDFFAVQPEDSFQAFYTESFMDDTVSLGVTSIDGAIFIHGGRSFAAIPFVQDSTSEYFDTDGQSLRRAFLKAPLDFFRITSRFTNSRFHPVLKYYRAHHGVDYAAPPGTPVKSIGSGKVIDMGFQSGGGGNHVKIQHNSVYATSYMHLRGFAKGLRKGGAVQQGEVIGYVGSTGLSTGPHLDFRVYKNGTPINPLSMESPPSHPVRPELTASFQIVKQELLHRFSDSRMLRRTNDSPIP
jgi:murein DD-endopeptidase MepM/ murein hydrolase activator NlpD